MSVGFGLGLRGWNGRVQRSTRAGQRRLDVARGRAGPAPRSVKTFWWDAQANFGDQLNVDVLHRLGVDPRLSGAADAELIPIGSLLEHVPASYAGTVWGSGMIFDRQVRLPLATILALRGHLTWQNLGSPGSPALGDPGLLARWTYGAELRRATSAPVTLVPHLAHRRSDSVRRLVAGLGDQLDVVDVTRPAREVVSRISRASAVVSTSLHGLVVADSYGIPAAWWQPEPPLAGGSFKFRDYESVIAPDASRGRDVDPRMSVPDLQALCAAADRSLVAETVTSLRSCLVDHLHLRPCD